jgi:hypothetical protein
MRKNGVVEKEEARGVELNGSSNNNNKIGVK